MLVLTIYFLNQCNLWFPVYPKYDFQKLLHQPHFQKISLLYLLLYLFHHLQNVSSLFFDISVFQPEKGGVSLNFVQREKRLQTVNDSFQQIPDQLLGMAFPVTGERPTDQGHGFHIVNFDEFRKAADICDHQKSGLFFHSYKS